MSLFFFDRGLEVLMMVNGDQTQALVWDRPVWEACGFTLLGMRSLPSAPKPIHDHLVAMRTPRRDFPAPHEQVLLALASAGRERRVQ